MQIIALDGAAPAAFALGRLYQSLTDWHRRTPPATVTEKVQT